MGNLKKNTLDPKCIIVKIGYDEGIPIIISKGWKVIHLPQKESPMDFQTMTVPTQGPAVSNFDVLWVKLPT